jgi:hypothetical protein
LERGPGVVADDEETGLETCPDESVEVGKVRAWADHLSQKLALTPSDSGTKEGECLMRALGAVFCDKLEARRSPCKRVGSKGFDVVPATHGEAEVTPGRDWGKTTLGEKRMALKDGEVLGICDELAFLEVEGQAT